MVDFGLQLLYTRNQDGGNSGVLIQVKPSLCHHCHILKRYNQLCFESFTHFSFPQITFQTYQHSRQDSNRASRSMMNGDCKIPRRRSQIWTMSFLHEGLSTVEHISN